MGAAGTAARGAVHHGNRAVVGARAAAEAAALSRARISAIQSPRPEALSATDFAMRTPRRLLNLALMLLPAFAGAAELTELIRNGTHEEALAALRDGADVNAVQSDGSTPLLWAVYRV